MKKPYLSPTTKTTSLPCLPTLMAGSNDGDAVDESFDSFGVQDIRDNGDCNDAV